MLSEPKLEQRDAQPYAAIRSTVTFQELSAKLPPLIDEVFGWLSNKGMAPVGAPMFRYLGGDMSTMLEIDVGVPVATAVQGDDRVIADELPVGRYAVILHTGDYSGLASAHAALFEWGARNGIEWQDRVPGSCDCYGARLESYITDPTEQPDPSKWETEVAFLTKS
jgi:effector-binding domain-containing protein